TCYSGFVWNNKFVVIGGRNDPSISLPYVSVYDPPTNSWSSLTPLPHGLHGPVAGFVDGRFVVTTGYYQVGGYHGFQSATYLSNILSTSTGTPGPTTPYVGVPFNTGQTIASVQYDYGGEGVAYH